MARKSYKDWLLGELGSIEALDFMSVNFQVVNQLVEQVMHWNIFKSYLETNFRPGWVFMSYNLKNDWRIWVLDLDT